MSMFLTDKDCIRQREYVNIPAWHKAGYTGKGISVFCDDIGGDHVECVADIIQVILPDAKIYTGSINYIKNNDGIKECEIYCDQTKENLPFDTFVKKYNISLINNSTDGGNGEEILPEAIFMKEKIKKYNLIMCGASGNSYGGKTAQPYNGACIIVTSANLVGDKPVYGKKSIGNNIDFTMFHGFQSGSSFSSPFLLAMAGLLRSKYPNITQDKVYEYFKTHCEDIGNDGKDKLNGWGLPILGNPNEKWEIDNMIIKLQVGNKIMLVDGKEIPLDQAPIQDPITWRTLIPTRVVSEAFGAKVEWDEKTKTVTITK